MLFFERIEPINGHPYSKTIGFYLCSWSEQSRVGCPFVLASESRKDVMTNQHKRIQHLTDQEIADKVNSMTFDELVDGHEEQQHADDKFQKSRMPLYVIVAAAFIIGIINSSNANSDISMMCFVFGGGTFIYLWVTRNNGPGLPRR